MTEGPYELSEGWRWVKLGEVCEHKTGLWGPEAPNTGEGFPVVRSTEIAGYRIDPQSASVRLIPREKAKGYALQSGDILVNKSSGSPHLVGWPTIFENPGDGRVYLFSNFMLRLRLDQKRAIPWFVLYYLHSPEARAVYLNAQDTTSGLRNLRVSDFINHPLPLPPLSEQRRIVERIEELMEWIREARRLREEARQNTERLWQAVLAETFPRPGSELPEGWRWVRLGEVVTFERGAKKPTDLPPELPFVGMEHVEPDTGIVDIANCPPVSSVTSQVYLYNQNHVLYGKLRPYLNKVYLPKEEGACSTEFVPLRPTPSYVDRHFLAWYLRSSGFVSYANAHTTGARQPRVDLRALVAALIPLPPLSEQRRIVAYLEAAQEHIQALKEKQAATEAELKRLEQAILEKAFRGEL